MKYKNIFAITLLLFFTTINLHAQDFEQITMDLSNPDKKGVLVVDLKKGTISVKGTARKDVLIKYASLPNNHNHNHNLSHKNKNKNKNKHKNKSWKNEDEKDDSAGLKKIAAASLDLEISEDDNRVRIQSDDWNRGLILEIEIPQEMDLNLDSYNQGDIEVDNVTGALELTSYNGPISATNISGSVIADTYNGKILATFNKVTPKEPMVFSNYNGGLDLTFPKDIAATFKINNKQGDVYTGFDMVMESQKPEKKGTKKIIIGQWVVGNVNGGGAEIKLENYNGNIYIRTNE